MSKQQDQMYSKAKGNWIEVEAQMWERVTLDINEEERYQCETEVFEDQEGGDVGRRISGIGGRGIEKGSWRGVYLWIQKPWKKVEIDGKAREQD